jgi:hypothetical protein
LLQRSLQVCIALQHRVSGTLRLYYEKRPRTISATTARMSSSPGAAPRRDTAYDVKDGLGNYRPLNLCIMFKTSIFGTINWTMIYHFDQPLKKNLQEQNEPTPGSNVSSAKRDSIPRASLILLSSLLLTIMTSCTLHFPIVAKLYRRHGLLFFLT